MTTILLTRHGQSTWNAERRWQGQADPPLSSLGRDQAYFAASRVGAVDLIASSPQMRALESATIIATQLGLEPVIVVEDLRERSAGPWSGLTRAEIEQQWPGWVESGERPDGYELDDPLFTRVNRALRELTTEYPVDSMLVLSHGGVIKAVEEQLGRSEGRVPNLSGRILQSPALGVGERDGGEQTNSAWIIGDQIRLLDEDLSTGGDGIRV